MRSVGLVLLLAAAAAAQTLPASAPDAPSATAPAGAADAPPPAAPETTSAPAGEPATEPATETAPVETVVTWHADAAAARADAAARKIPLLLIYLEPAAPASEMFLNQVLANLATRRFLSAFAAIKLDIAVADNRKAFEATGTKETPLTLVFAPDGKDLLDAIPGCVLPAEAFRARLAASLEYLSRSASAACPPTAAQKWGLIEARLKLSTRAAAVPLIEDLLALPPKALPEGATPGRLEVAWGNALLPEKADEARAHFTKALDLGGDDPLAGGAALLALGKLTGAADFKAAHDYRKRYIEKFPDGPEIGTAYIERALLEWRGLDNKAAARATLEEFIARYPDNPQVVEAKKWLDFIK